MAFQGKPKNKRNRNRKKRSRQDDDGFDKRVINIRRVAKVRAGAKRLRFSAVVAVGNKKGKVGVAVGRGVDTRAAIEKGTRIAKNRSVVVDLVGDTIPHEVNTKYHAAKLVLRPAGPGTGIIASNAVRAVMEVAGIKNILTKQLGTNNQVTNAYCAFEALKELDKKRIMEKRSSRLRKKVNTKQSAAKSKPRKAAAKKVTKASSKKDGASQSKAKKK